MDIGYSGNSCVPKALTGEDCAHLGLHEAIDIVIRKFPRQVAVSYQSNSLTYSELDVLANHIANLLAKQNVGVGHSVAILMKRSDKMIVSLLAILRLGAAYIPIDPSYPKDRIDFILQDTGARALILGDSLTHDFQDLEIPIITEDLIPTDSKSGDLLLDTHDLKEGCNQFKVSDLAYIIYTSGSTGMPKGVQVTHANVHNYAYWAREEFGMTESDNVDFSSTLAFDISVRATIVPLLAGACIQICSEEVKELPHHYLKYLSESKVTLMTVTPSYFGLLTKLLPNQSVPLALRTIWLIGETSVPPDVKAWQSYYPEHEIINEYGPTEATVGILAYRVLYNDPCLDMASIPVGVPAYNTTIYILDDEERVCSDGTTGQICISGASVTQGYLNREQLNNAVFTRNPFSPGDTLYKTGDLGRMQSSGNIEHLGRSDRQIKVRGFRIEPGEIETVLMAHGSINFATISPWESSGEIKLAAYVVLLSGASTSVFELRQHLQKRLPGYMLPSNFVFLDKVPLTLNGKLDRSALPPPGDLGENIENVPPDTEIEKVILEMWHSVLDNSHFGVTDNFFLLGGESLSAAQIVRMIEKYFSVTLPLGDFYSCTNVRALSVFVSMKESSAMSQDDALLLALAEVESMSTAEINEQLEKQIDKYE